jgi:hypothetical protein
MSEPDWAESAAKVAIAALEEMSRPFYLLRPRVFPDGDTWCALYGGTIRDGICGYGDTPLAASYDFDNNFCNQKRPSPRLRKKVK